MCFKSGARTPTGCIGDRMLPEYRFPSHLNPPFAALLLIALMLLSSANASITQWSGPSTISSEGTVRIVNGFTVPGNATILDGWVDVGVDGMVNDGYGRSWSSIGADFYNGTLDKVTTDHLLDILTLAPDSNLNQISDFESGLEYSFSGAMSESGRLTELWKMSDLVMPNMQPVGGNYSMPYGDVPSVPPQGSFVIGTEGMNSVAGDIYQSLEMPAFAPPQPMNDFQLSFTHWYHLNTSADVTGDGDGVWVEYRIDNGDWRFIAPEEGYTNTLDPELQTLEFTLDGDYDDRNSSLYVNEAIPANVPWTGTLVAEDGSMANYTGHSTYKFFQLDQSNETAFNSSALDDTNISVNIAPTNAPTGGVHGFPVWSGMNASGWLTSTFNLSNYADITAANILQFRFNIRTDSNTPRPGWFLDDIQMSNPGVLYYASWLYGCSPNAGCTNPNGLYTSGGGGSLVFPLDLSQATVDPTLEFDADWALEGGSPYGDHFFIEVSTDNASWQDVIAVGGSPSNPIPGASGMGDTDGFEHLTYIYPSGFVGDASTWLRIRVETDSSLNCAYPQTSEHCGVFFDNLTVYDSMSGTVFMNDEFADATAGWHEAAPHGGYNPNLNLGTDDWNHIINHQGSYQYSEGFENPVAIAAIGFRTVEIKSGSPWEFGEIPSPWPSAGPTSFASSTHGFGVALNGLYSNSMHSSLTSPIYTLIDNATSYVSFSHWLCAEPNWDGGTVLISVNGSQFTQFNPYVAGGYNDSWYDNTITSGSAADNPLFGYDVFAGVGYGQISGGGSCPNVPGWQNMRGTLENYAGSQVQFRLEFANDGAWAYDGWYVDDFGIVVDYFETEGLWSSELIALDDLGAGFVDAQMETPNGTWITGSVTNAGGQIIPGFENLSIPFSLAGLDLDVYPDIKLQLNFGTVDPHFTPKLHELFFGGLRAFDSKMAEFNGWDVPLSGLEITDAGNMTITDGQPKTFSGEFLYSSRPMKTFEFLSDGVGISATFTDIDGNPLGTITTGQKLVLDIPQPGFGVDVTMQANGFAYWFAPIGNFANPAFNPQIDLLRDGVIDWYFPADPYYGHYGWQNRYYGVTEDGNFTSSVGSNRGLDLTFDSGETIILHTLVPQNATLEIATLSMIITNTDSGSINLTTTVLSQSVTHNGLLDGQNIVPLPRSGALNSSPILIDANQGRTFWDLQIELTSDNAATIDMGPMAIGYNLTEIITGLEPVFEPYHQANNENGTAGAVDYNLSFLADRGGVSLDGGIQNELLITNEPFSPPETFYPDGTIQTVTTAHHHLYDNDLIDMVSLRGEASSGAEIEVVVQDLGSSPIFSQVKGPEFLTLVPSSSSTQLISGHWVVDWAFTVNWDWDDEGLIAWESLATDADGYGISPYTAYSGGAGANAVENDLIIKEFEVFDQFGRLIVEDSWVAGNRSLTVFGNVSFQDAIDRMPESDAFAAVANLSGVIVNMTVGGNGSFSGQTTTPVRSEEDAGLIIRYPISAMISRVGPGDGAVGGTDESRPTPTIEFRIDDDSPHAKRLQIYTLGQYISADGYTWDPAKDLPLLLTISDNQSMGSEVTMHYWIQDLHDLFDAELGSKNGVPDSNEYGTLTMSLFNAGIAGEETVNFLPLNVEDNEDNHRVSIYFSGVDFAGNQYIDGGGPGFENDFATIYTAINEPTSIQQSEIYLDRAAEYLMAGQNHTMSIVVDEPNGIGTIDFIRIHLDDSENTIGVMTYYPVTGEFSTPLGSYVTINGVEVIEMGNSRYTVDIFFQLAWDFPIAYTEQWSSPSLILRDTDPITNPNIDDLVLPNLGHIRWVLDTELEIEILSMSDITPPMTEPSTDRLYVAEGDEVLIVGEVKFANSGEAIKTIPDGMLVHLSLWYGTDHVEADSEVSEEGGGFELSVQLPGRALQVTNIPLLFSITGIPEIGVDVTDIDAMIIVDSSAPIVQFIANQWENLASDDLSAKVVNVIVDDLNGGMPNGPLSLQWAFTEGFGGPEIIGSRDSVELDLKAHPAGTWTYSYEGVVDMTPNSGVRLDIGDGLVVWVVGEDLAGNAIGGSGTEAQPRYVEIEVKTFILDISEINVYPNNPFVGEELKITYLAKNVGNKDGVGNVSLQIRNDFGNWTTISSTMVELAAQQSFEPVAFRYEVGSAGLLEMRIIVDGFEAEPFPITGSNGLPIEVESGERDEGGIPGFVWLLLGGIAVLAVLLGIAVVIRRGDDEDYLDEADEVYEKSAPGVPTSHGRDPTGDASSPAAEPAHPDLPEAMDAFPTWGEDVLLQYLTAGWSIEQMRDEFYE